MARLPQTRIVVGRRVRAFRAARGWSQADLAARAGLHRVTIANLERGAHQPSLDTLAVLAVALDVSLSALLESSA